MGQFKPMVKMMTDEPSVILKLKKGGKVHHKAKHEEHEEHHGHKPMHHGMHEESEHGHSPKKPSMHERRKAMNPNMYKKGGKVEKHEDAAQDRAMIKKALAGKKFASGGAIDRDETKTTIESGAKKFMKTKVVDGDHHDKHHGTKGIKDGAVAGYKHGGHAHKHHKATGGAIPSDTHEKKNSGKIKMHGTIEGNEHDYVNTEMHEAKRDRAHGTKGIKESNAGGFKKGGKVPGIGRAIEHDGDWEDRPADGTPKGKTNGTTGGVKEANGGGYKHGGHASKKHYATGGNVVNDGKAVKMPRHFLSQPVANSLQSGTFAKGGKVEKNEKPNLRLVKTHTGPKGHVAKVYKDKDYGEYRTKFYSPEGKHHTEADSHTDDAEDAHMTAMHEVNRGYKKGGKISHKADGGLQDLSKGQYDKSIGPDEDDMDMARTIRNIPSKLFEGAKSMIGMGAKSAGAGRGFVNPKSVTETQKSVTVTPRKRGGKC